MPFDEQPVLQAFHDAAEHVAAYRRLLGEQGVRASDVRTIDDFRGRAPVLDKAGTFLRFPLADLCRDGQIVPASHVITSSGHSGRFSFGLYDPGGAEAEVRRTDEALDQLFGVRSKRTLLVNCLPMGVKVPTRACTLAETSVRADMVVSLVGQLGRDHDQTILVGEAAFIKHVLELGQDQGVDWKGLLVHLILGEEPLAENARKYFAGILGCDGTCADTGLIGSSMGVAEIGLNLFFELPPLIALRQRLHEDPVLRGALFGKEVRVAPLLFAYDPRRILVEVLEHGRLVLTTLDPMRRIPLIRYATGDVASLPFESSSAQEAFSRIAELKACLSPGMPVLALHGRGEHVLAGGRPVTPEEVKEGIYLEPSLARLTTACFRLAGGDGAGLIRIQLSPGVRPEPDLADRFAIAISKYVDAPLNVACELYEDFKYGMELNYERKFDYLGP